MLIHPKAPITWVEEGVIHVLCYRPGLVTKPRKAQVSGVVGLRDGRLFLPPASPARISAPALEARLEQSAEIGPTGSSAPHAPAVR